jgi:hypothetical protein
MKVTQQYFLSAGRVGAALILLAMVGSQAPAAARGRIAPAHAPSDSILTGPDWGPCASAVFSPDYVAGMDSYGYPVPPADPPGNVTAALPSDVVLPEVFTHIRGVGRVEVPVEIPGLAAATAGPPVCAPHLHPKKG